MRMRMTLIVYGNFSVLKTGYGLRQIAFLTQNPFKWCGIFKNDRRFVAVG
jgi:hypothetical protein